MAVIRGVVTTESGSVGYYQTVNTDVNTEKGTVEDETGNTAEVEYFNPTSQVQIEAKYKSTATLPDLSSIDGDSTTKVTITLSNSTDTNLNGLYCVETASLKEGNKDFMTYSMTLMRWLANGVPSA